MKNTDPTEAKDSNNSDSSNEKYIVEEYNESYFLSTMRKLLFSPRPDPCDKLHYKYFKGYLQELKTAFFVVEREYISRDYLKDYSDYYSTCYRHYPQKCARIHFFGKKKPDFESKEYKKHFDKFILGGPDSIIDDKGGEPVKFEEAYDYDGFIVIKPIPGIFIGLTILKPYPEKCDDGGERDFWALKNYHYHLFGNDMFIDSLAFQEQDSALAACATMAIWNVFQKALDYDFSVHRSPGEITRGLGLISSINGNRLIPNTDGLTPYEMSALISQNGLLPLVIEIDEIRMKIKDLDSYIKKIVHAYSGLHLPIIFHITINADGSGAGHAIAVCGCGKSNSGTGGKDWISDNITTLYAHDDQFGPFTKIKFINGYKIETEWDRYYLKDLKNIKGLRKSYINKHTDITSIIIPTFPDFKITYETIQDSRIFELFEHFVLTKENAYKIETWDIRALFSEDYKSHLQSELKKSPSCGSRCRYTLFSLLTKSLPKYIWVISGYNSEKLLVELIIDATGLDNDLQYAGLIAYYDEITDTMKYNYEQFLVNSPRLHEKDHTFYKEYLV